jgi:Rieske 2Fe-2S family protein
MAAPTIPRSPAIGQRCEDAGLPSKFQISPDGQFRAARMPLIEDAESYTMSGKRAVAVRCRTTSRSTGSAPCCCSTIRRRGTTSRRPRDLFPRLAAQRQRDPVTTKWLVHKDAVEGVDYNLEELTHVWTETNDQDRRIVEENAFGIHSPAYEPGPYSMLARRRRHAVPRMVLELHGQPPAGRSGQAFRRRLTR